MDGLITFCAQYLIIIAALIGVVYWLGLGRKNKIRLAAVVIIGLIIAVVIAKIASKLYYDPRPFVKSNVTPLFAHPADNGFPSDHTYLAATMATCVYFFQRRLGLGLFLLAIIIGVARVAAHVHSPIDIVGGLVIGLVSGTLSYLLVRRFNSRRPAK